MKDCILVRKKEIDKALAQKPIQGKRQLEPIKSLFLSKKIHFGIMEDHEVSEIEIEVHEDEADLWICLEGEAEFTYGDKKINATLKPGDILYVPAGQPHAHTASKTARMLIIKIPER